VIFSVFEHLGDSFPPHRYRRRESWMSAPNKCFGLLDWTVRTAVAPKSHLCCAFKGNNEPQKGNPRSGSHRSRCKIDWIAGRAGDQKRSDGESRWIDLDV